ncbi:MAG: hypothetical protein ABIY55_05375 [Kofleriaceae bacterium]
MAFLQQVDKPRFLVPLLMPYQAYFRQHGLDVGSLRNSDEHDRQLLDVFCAPNAALPRELLETLYVLDDLADEAGHDLILAELDRHEIPLRGLLAEELSPGEFAIAVYRRYPQLVRDVHESTGFRRTKSFEEFQAKRARTITIERATAMIPGLEELLAPWFESKNRSRACKIAVHQEGDELRFQITHGRPYRTIGAIDNRLERSRIGYRPQQHDTVVFGQRDGVLKVNAHTEAERDLYRQAIGMAFFEDENFFPVGNVYSLAPLRAVKPVLVVGADVESAKLIEVQIQLEDRDGVVRATQGRDLLSMVDARENGSLAPGKIIGATFLLSYRSGGLPRRLEIRPPNIAIYDRARDGDAAEAFMRRNGLLIGALP